LGFTLGTWFANERQPAKEAFEGLEPMTRNCHVRFWEGSATARSPGYSVASSYFIRCGFSNTGRSPEGLPDYFRIADHPPRKSSWRPCSSHAGTNANTVLHTTKTYTLRAVSDQCIHNIPGNVRTWLGRNPPVSGRNEPV